MLVSAGAIYNEMLDRAPELAAVLFRPIATDRRGEVPSGATGWFSIPVLNWHAGHLTVLYQRQYIESAQRFDEVPRLTDQVLRGARPVRRGRQRPCDVPHDGLPSR